MKLHRLTKVLLFNFLLLFLPLGLNAVGLGFYVPFSFEEESSASYSVELQPNHTLKTNYNESVGFGLVMDTNVQKDQLFNYRLGVEALKRKIKDINQTSCIDGCNYGTRVNSVHTFGFSIIRNEYIRVWTGPRINIALNTEGRDNDYERFELEVGIAPALGINVNLAEKVSLSFDIDYRLSNILGYSDDSGEYSKVSYSGTTQGATARLYIIFKINDGF